LYAGFGIPILEAMQRGISIACSNAASIPEVTGEAALMFNSLAEDEIAKSIEILMKSPGVRHELICKGYANVTKYSWISTAEKTLEIYNNAIQKGRFTGG
jgi:alpha-1,3-rhamnosyl/mannosyltransferase